MISFEKFILSLYPFYSYNNDAFGHNTKACSVTYYLESNIADTILLKQQVFYHILSRVRGNEIHSFPTFSLPIGTGAVILIDSY